MSDFWSKLFEYVGTRERARLEKSKASHTTAYKLQANAMQCMHYAICVFKEQRSTIVGDRVREGHNKIVFDKLVPQLCGQTISCNILIVQIREVLHKKWEKIDETGHLQFLLFPVQHRVFWALECETIRAECEQDNWYNKIYPKYNTNGDEQWKCSTGQLVQK